MTNKEFVRLLSYQRAKNYAFKPSVKLFSRFKAKNMSNKQQGRALVPLEQVFLKGEYKH